MSRATFSTIAASLATISLLLASSAVIAGPKWIQIGGDGATTDVTQGKRGKTTTTDPTTTTGGTTTTDTTTSGTTTDTTSGTTTESAIVADYLPTLSPTYTPAQLRWLVRDYRVNAPATDYANLPHSVKHGANWNRIRFEVRPDDPAMESNAVKRRAEMSGSIYGDPTRLPNGKELWGAFSIIQTPWSDPEGMKSTYGGVYGQIHMGSKVGGSPALAFRRHQGGNLRITTRGEFDDAGTTRYDATLSWGVVHDFVYQLTLDPVAGKLRVWIDGRKVVDVANVSIGHSLADSYWNFGLYFPGGVTAPVSAEYGNHVYPSQYSLLNRVTAPPQWPAD